MKYTEFRNFESTIVNSVYILKPGSVNMSNVIGNIDSSLLPRRTGGKIVVADQIYRGRFRFASKNCENNKNTGFATLFLQRKDKRKKADVNVNKRLTKTTITCRNQEISSQEFFAETWPKMTFLAKCVFLMANNLEQERNIDGISLEIVVQNKV